MCECYTEEARQGHELWGEGYLFRVIATFRDGGHYIKHVCDSCIVQDLEYCTDPLYEEDYKYILIIPPSQLPFKKVTKDAIIHEFNKRTGSLTKRAI